MDSFGTKEKIYEVSYDTVNQAVYVSIFDENGFSIEIDTFINVGNPKSFALGYASALNEEPNTSAEIVEVSLEDN